jgi:hypothetical protein
MAERIKRPPFVLGALGDDRADFGGGGEQLGGFRADDFEIIVFGSFGVVRGDGVGDGDGGGTDGVDDGDCARTGVGVDGRGGVAPVSVIVFVFAVS